MMNDYKHEDSFDDNEVRGQGVMGFLADVLKPLDDVISEKLVEVNKRLDRCFQGSIARCSCFMILLSMFQSMLTAALVERTEELLWMFVACLLCCMFIGVLFNKFKRHREKKPGDRKRLFWTTLLPCVVIAELMDYIDVAGLFTFDELDVFMLMLLMLLSWASAYTFADTPESKGDDNDSRFCMPPDRQLPEMTKTGEARSHVSAWRVHRKQNVTTTEDGDDDSNQR